MSRTGPKTATRKAHTSFVGGCVSEFDCYDRAMQYLGLYGIAFYGHHGTYKQVRQTTIAWGTACEQHGIHIPGYR